MRPEPPPLLRDPPPNHGRPRIIARGTTDQVVRIGLRTNPLRDLYHNALRLSWPAFLAIGAGAFLALNVLFGALYALQPDGISDLPHGSFLDAFFFSVQTLATIGYGRWAPVSLYANTVVTFEALAATSFFALYTGLAFARFARPTSHIAFARHVVVTDFDGARVLMLRVANERGNQILEATVSVSLLRNERTAEGQFFRRLHDLSLRRSHTPVFGLTFVAMHPIDETSPLFGVDAEGLLKVEAELVIIVSGLDDTMMQTVHGRYSYDAAEILFDRRFADLFGFLPDGRLALDYRQFHETVPSRADVAS